LARLFSIVAEEVVIAAETALWTELLTAFISVRTRDSTIGRNLKSEP